MRKLTFGFVLIGLLLLVLQSHSTQAIKRRPASDIDKIMSAGFGGYPPGFKKPLAKALDGKATKGDLETLLRLCTELNQAKPPKGDQDEWKATTRVLIQSVQAVIANNSPETLAKLKTASDCKTCHARFHLNADEEAKRMK